MVCLRGLVSGLEQILIDTAFSFTEQSKSLVVEKNLPVKNVMKCLVYM
jgi:hypothetical protein